MKYLYHHRTQGLNVEGVHVRSICQALDSMGHEVRLISVTSTNDQYTHAPVTNNNLNPNEKKNYLKTLAKNLPEPIFECLELGYNLYAFFRLWWVIHVYRPDCIYERYSLFLFSTLLLGKMYSIPVVYEINDSAQLVRLRPLFFKRFAAWIEKQVFSKATGLVYVSYRLKEIIEDAYGINTKSVVSPNAADKTIFYYDQQAKDEAKNKLSLNDKIVCGFIGCFARWHGVHHFMAKLAPLLKQHPKLTLLLVGDGETLAEVKKIVIENDLEDQVIITGNVPHGEIIDYIRAMDLSILPSSNEYGSPMKMFELMGAGVPLVAADYPPVVEVLEDGKDGWLFPQGDFDACIAKLFDVYSDSESLAHFAKNAEAKIHQKHQWINNTCQLDSLVTTSK